MEKVIIIAEAGVNHNGSMTNAFRLIDAALEAGADMIKFQTFKTELAISKTAKKADYQIENTRKVEETQFEMVKKLELSFDDQFELVNYCKKKGIHFFSTAFDLESLNFLRDIGLDLVKIPSGEITNLPYLRKAAQLFKKVILSTGMCTMEEIEAAVNVFLAENILKDDITILHCNTEYPTPMIDVNLKAMLSIEQKFGTAIGYSDHTLGIEVPIAAVALGASIIEKHFTLDNTMEGPDHAASLEPNQLKEMVNAVRNIEQAISGNGVKKPSASEMKNIAIARKSIVASAPISKGDIFTEHNLTVKRPGSGVSPMKWDEVIGRVAVRDFNEDELIEL